MINHWIRRFIGHRGSRRLPRGWRALPPALLGLIARQRRAAGYYDMLTLLMFRRAWRLRPAPRRLFDYLAFRRDLGGRVPMPRVPDLVKALPRLDSGRRRLAVAMLAESAPGRLAQLPVPLLASVAARMPGGAAVHGEPLSLADIGRCQERWRADFAASLRACRSICVVGNGGALLGAGLGAFIDSHGLVVRFNVFRGLETDMADIGGRIDVWVASPNLSLPPPAEARWVVVTGPDVRYRLQDWDWLLPHRRRGGPILTVPLEVWRGLVLRLQAPPSAGILILAWLRYLRGGWDGITAVGFGSPAGRPYHHAVPRQPPVTRHHWQAERELLDGWSREGLSIRGCAERRTAVGARRHGQAIAARRRETDE